MYETKHELLSTLNRYNKKAISDDASEEAGSRLQN